MLDPNIRFLIITYLKSSLMVLVSLLYPLFLFTLTSWSRIDWNGETKSRSGPEHSWDKAKGITLSLHPMRD